MHISPEAMKSIFFSATTAKIFPTHICLYSLRRLLITWFWLSITILNTYKHDFFSSTNLIWMNKDSFSKFGYHSFSNAQSQTPYFFSLHSDSFHDFRFVRWLCAWGILNTKQKTIVAWNEIERIKFSHQFELILVRLCKWNRFNWNVFLRYFQTYGHNAVVGVRIYSFCFIRFALRNSHEIIGFGMIEYCTCILSIELTHSGEKSERSKRGNMLKVWQKW